MKVVRKFQAYPSLRVISFKPLIPIEPEDTHTLMMDYMKLNALTPGNPLKDITVSLE